MKKILVLIMSVALVNTVTHTIEFEAYQYNNGDHHLKYFETKVINDSSWMYGTWDNTSNIDTVYGRIRNSDNLFYSPAYQYTGDAHLKLEHVSSYGSTSSICTGGYTNLKPGDYISCYSTSSSNDHDKFRTNVKWSRINDVADGTCDPSLYIMTGIEGGYRA